MIEIIREGLILLLFIIAFYIFIYFLYLSFDSLDYSFKHNKKFYLALLLLFLCVAGLIWINKIKPVPTYRQICEYQGGTYIDNNGRTGDFCVYSGGNNERN